MCLVRVINPWRTCTARVTVVGLCVCTYDQRAKLTVASRLVHNTSLCVAKQCDATQHAREPGAARRWPRDHLFTISQPLAHMNALTPPPFPGHLARVVGSKCTAIIKDLENVDYQRRNTSPTGYCPTFTSQAKEKGPEKCLGSSYFTETTSTR